MKQPNSQYQLQSYDIVPDVKQADTPYKIKDAKLAKELEAIARGIQKDLSGTETKLTSFIRNHPEIPQAKNYLSIWYQKKGNLDKTLELNQQLLQEYPDYLFARINMALHYGSIGKPEKMVEFLGEAMEIQSLYPNRKKFHYEEVLAFFRAAIAYYLAVGDLHNAEIRFQIMDQIDADHPATLTVQQEIFDFKLKNLKDLAGLFKGGFDDEEMPNGSQPLPEQTEKAPELNHKELKVLYEEGLYIKAEALKNILALPRESLIKDLEAILLDSVKRFEYFVELNEKKKLKEENASFPIHALFLLAELRAAESLPTVLYYLGQSEEVLSFWVGDYITEKVWEVIYFIGQDRLTDLKAFVSDQRNNLFSSTAICMAVEQLAYHQPERKNEVIEWFRSLFQYFLEENRIGDFVNDELVAFVVSHSINLKAEELLPLIKELDDKELIDVTVEGDYEEIKQTFNEVQPNKKALRNIYDNYTHITDTWASYTEGEEDGFSIFDSLLLNEDEDEDKPEKPLLYPLHDLVEPRHVEQKVGRNDPCPCGSGKKYKKCCMNS